MIPRILREVRRRQDRQAAQTQQISGVSHVMRDNVETNYLGMDEGTPGKNRNLTRMIYWRKK